VDTCDSVRPEMMNKQVSAMTTVMMTTTRGVAAEDVDARCHGDDLTLVDGLLKDCVSLEQRRTPLNQSTY